MEFTTIDLKTSRNVELTAQKKTTAIPSHRGGNEGCYLLLVGVSMKNQFGITGIYTI